MKARILLVEDNDQNSYLATFLLENAGHVVTRAENGRRALELAAVEPPPELILMDIQMPEMDGYEAARRLLANPRLAQIPLVAVTSYAMTGDRERAMNIGFSGYIEKPIDPDQFITQIQAFLPRADAHLSHPEERS